MDICPICHMIVSLSLIVSPRDRRGEVCDLLYMMCSPLTNTLFLHVPTDPHIFHTQTQRDQNQELILWIDLLGLSIIGLLQDDLDLGSDHRRCK